MEDPRPSFKSLNKFDKGAGMDTLTLFADLFKGRRDVWGSVNGRSNKEEVTIENYRLHLEGKTSLGVYPLLDDGTVNFFAVDLDEKVFKKAVAIRNELKQLNVLSYICKSKSKGYHVYGFVDKPTPAKEVRILMGGVLDKLKIAAEIFPKQDYLDEVIKYGNYINLPCFGESRKFQTVDEKPVKTETALALINKNTSENIIKAAGKIPPPPPVVAPKSPKKPKGKKLKSPPCVMKILQGVDHGMRDEAAFALARHFLDQDELPEEVLARLMIWDARNKPPISDMRILQTKVQSAEHGYAFGCNSIESGLLSGFCIGKAHCEWLKRETEEKKKQGLIVETSLFEDGDIIYEEIVRNPLEPTKAEAVFLAYNTKTKAISEVKEVIVGDITYIPIYGSEISEGLVAMPDGVEEYGSTEELIQEIISHIHHYADLPEIFKEWAAWYVLMSWVYDRLPAVVYMRFLGDFGTGKSRTIDTIGDITYKRTKLIGAITLAPIFRTLHKFRGSLVLDENDMDKSDETTNLVKLLNSGIERGSPIVRCLKDNPDVMQIFKVYGPKVFGTRKRFGDMALESRCLTTIMEETDRKIGAKSPEEAKETNAIAWTYASVETDETTSQLRRKLLLFRLRHLSSVPKKFSQYQDIDLGDNLSGRLQQVCMPFATIFQHNPETMDKFRRFLEAYQAELRGENADSYQGRVVSALFKAAKVEGKHQITATAIANIAKEENKIDITVWTVSKILKSMHILIDKPRKVAGKTYRFVHWDDSLMRKIYSRYQSGEPEALDVLGLETHESVGGDEPQSSVPEAFR